ncbi:MAG TPA: carboxypeptidase regulatory-like domain-containing protein, partial [Bryobacteraceae bacterium]|nr:carboxypeptidase regulatory-like domain-containing protein [Bryobacteraceae bacterium]
MKRLLLVLLATVLVTWAQQDRGTFTGTVTDQSGSLVPNVKVTVVNTETNATYETVTNEVGQYRVPNLPIGTYRLTFESSGFKAHVREGVTLNIAAVTRIDAVMQVGATSESIEVTAEAPLLQTETPEVGTVLNTRQVVDLPLGFGGGRYAENFAYKLTPGVAGNNWESRINGSPSFAKEVVLDGADATIYIGGHLGESSPSMEAIEEFKIQTSGMSAEFGRTGGGVFNFVLKSGTNQLHGSAMGQIHNEWMDANTFANNFYGRPRRLDRRHNYAFSGGAPIYIPKIYNGRDKSFFYVAYERYKEAYGGGGSPTVTLPLPEFWQGDFSRLLTNEVIGKDALGRDILRGAVYDPTTTKLV